MKHLSPWQKEKGCHGGETKNGATATYPKMMPRQHIGSGSSWRYLCKRKRADERNMQDGGVIPDSGFPRVSGMETSDNSDTVQTYGTSHTTHKHSFTVGHLGLYLGSVRFGAV